MRDDLFNWPPAGVRWFGGGAPSYTPPPVDTSAADKKAADEAAAKERDMMRRRRGRQSTILTGGMGLTDDAPTQTASLMSGKAKLGQ